MIIVLAMRRGKKMNLESLRENINAVDVEILKLLNQRMHFVADIGKIKRNSDNIFYVPSRESSLLNSLVEKKRRTA